MSSKEEDKGIRALQRALNVLKVFTLEEKTLSLTQIASKTKLAKSTTTRLLYTLEQNNFVLKDPVTLKYRLGKQLYILGYIAGQSIKLREVAQTTMERLRNQTKETVNLYVLENEHRICLLQYESLQSVKHMVKIGEKLPLTVGAAGKVILAYQSPEFIENIIRKGKLVENKSQYKKS
jgi:DNA-binding IclR family transcriptional regulator